MNVASAQAGSTISRPMPVHADRARADDAYRHGDRLDRLSRATRRIRRPLHSALPKPVTSANAVHGVRPEAGNALTTLSLAPGRWRSICAGSLRRRRACPPPRRSLRVRVQSCRWRGRLACPRSGPLRRAHASRAPPRRAPPPVCAAPRAPVLLDAAAPVRRAGRGVLPHRERCGVALRRAPGRWGEGLTPRATISSAYRRLALSIRVLNAARSEVLAATLCNAADDADRVAPPAPGCRWHRGKRLIACATP